MKKFTPFNPLSVQSFSGFDLSLKMSMNYLSRYLKGWRELEFISEYYYLLKDYIDSSSLFEMHHIYNNNDYLLVKMYPLFRLLKEFKKHQLKNILDVDLNKAYLKYIDVVLIMTVEPGFGGQAFMKNQLQKALILKNESQKNDLNFKIELDGGINTKTIEIIKNYPIDICVSGTCIFKSENMASTINKLKLR